jgi:hypothetical protein
MSTLVKDAGHAAGARYDDDFVEWVEAQRRHLLGGAVDRIDIENLADELQAMANSERDAVGSRLRVLIEHLLKLQCSPDQPPRNGWVRTVLEQRYRLEQKFEDSPSLVPWARRRLSRSYQQARRIAALDESLDEGALPSECPWSLEQLLDEAFFPGPADQSR